MPWARRKPGSASLRWVSGAAEAEALGLEFVPALGTGVATDRMTQAVVKRAPANEVEAQRLRRRPEADPVSGLVAGSILGKVVEGEPASREELLMLSQVNAASLSQHPDARMRSQAGKLLNSVIRVEDQFQQAKEKIRLAGELALRRAKLAEEKFEASRESMALRNQYLRDLQAERKKRIDAELKGVWVGPPAGMSGGAERGPRRRLPRAR